MSDQRLTIGDTLTMARHPGDCQCGCHWVAGQPGTVTQVHRDYVVAAAHKPSAAGGRPVEVAYLVNDPEAA